MKLVLTAFLFASFLFSAQSQTPSLEWVRNFGSLSNDYCTSIAIDNDGNSITIGNFGNTIDFDPGSGISNLTSNGHFDVFILKLDPSGGFIWAKSIGGDRGDMSISIKLDNNGNIFIAGSFSGTSDFDPGPGIHNVSTSDLSGGESFLLKLDADGNFLWVKQFANVELFAIDIDNKGNLYSTGGFYATTDFDPGPGIFNLTEYSYTGFFTGNEDVFVLKLDAMGNFQWVKQMGGNQTDQAKGISIDAAGNILTTGYFSGDADFDPGSGTSNLSSVGYLDVFISKLDPNGSFLWAKQIGGVLEDRSNDIITDVSGNIYIGGVFYSTVDFDPGIGVFNISPTGGDVFILKLNSLGTFIWAKQIGGSSNEHCWAITLDNAGGLYVAGTFQSTCDFDPGLSIFNLTSNGYQDIFITKLDNSGNFIWAAGMGSTRFDDPFDIEIDQSRNVYTVGFFWETVDFDPGPGNYYVSMVETGDAFIQKLRQCAGVTYSTINTSACNSYTLNNQVYTSSGIYIQRLLNVAGCDSIITLNLTLSGSTINLSTIACNDFFWEGKHYTTSGTFSKTYIDEGGCDSILNLNLIIIHNISSTINVNICEGESYDGYSTSGVYKDTFLAVNGCDSIRTLNLIVIEKLFYTINATICEGQSFEGYLSSGIYLDTFTSITGCDSIRTLHLVVNPKKLTNVNAAICEGQTYLAGGAAQTISGIYRDTLQSYFNCDSIVVTNLVVFQKPKPYLGVNENLCKDSSLILNPGTYNSYLWQDMSTHSTNTINSVGLYWVTVTDSNNCTATDSLRINNIFQPPANFLKYTDSVCTYDKLILQPIKNYNTYLWSTGVNQRDIIVQTPGKYWLKVTDTNGCQGTDTITVISKQCITGVFIPTAFTPNGDGKNDFFKAIIFGNVQSFKLQVFDRSGQLIFQTTNPIERWNGYYKGATYSTNTFVWQCFYQLEGEKTGYQKGTITLIR